MLVNSKWLEIHFVMLNLIYFNAENMNDFYVVISYDLILIWCQPKVNVFVVIGMYDY